MILEKGDMWQVFGKTDLFCFTANGTIKNDGSLVMGRGTALQVKEKILGIDFKFGRLISEDEYTYGLALYKWPGVQLMGAFQVKDDFRDAASLGLIKVACKKLFDWLMDNPTARVDLNFPGIGNGRLKRENVLPIIQLLPDNVHVWELE